MRQWIGSGLIVAILGVHAQEPLVMSDLVQEISFGEPEDVRNYLAGRTDFALASQEVGELFQAISALSDAQSVVIAAIIQDQGVPILSMRDHVGNAFLHYAAREGKRALVEWLVKSGADITAQNNGGESPRVKVKKGKEYDDILELLTPRLVRDMQKLLRIHAHIGLAHDPSARTEYRDIKNSVMLLLEDPSVVIVDPDLNDPSSRHPAYFAALIDHDIFKKMLMRDPAFISLKNIDKKTANSFLGAMIVEYAARSKELAEDSYYMNMLRENIRELLAYGASRNDTQYGVPTEGKTIAEYVALIKELVPRLYELFYPKDAPALGESLSQLALSVYTLSQNV